MTSSKKKSRVLLWLLVGMAVLMGAVVLWYAGRFCPADDTAVSFISQPHEGFTIEEKDGDLIFTPTDPGVHTGLIFYPGGGVDFRAYAPLMGELADRGIKCVLVSMPFDMALLDVGAAGEIRGQHPEIEHWYTGGHSLGALAATMYLERAHSDFDGVIFLGAYCEKDLSKTSLRALSVYGENDGVLNRERYEGRRYMMPKDFLEVIIPGGCHAYFGCYGEQKGDGTASVSPQEQQSFTADVIAGWIG